ncbi:hypothetical protein PM082_004630 [Marasmius tenuissimus]|nr:hypothetical protein PM082_004630 [Marasmius tenuissimus]
MSSGSSSQNSFRAFDDPAVRDLFKEYRATSAGSKMYVRQVVRFLTTRLDAIPDNDEDSEDDATQSIHSKYSTDTYNSLGVMPQKHAGGGAFKGSRHRLIVWLFVMARLCCPITNKIPHAKSVVQFAHLLIPQSEIQNLDMLNLYEFIMGMERGTLCIHSRLFIMPVGVGVHVLLDDYLLLFLPTVTLLQRMTTYLYDLAAKRMTNMSRQMKELTLEEKGNAEQSPWIKLRSTNGSPFTAGTINEFYLVQHPDLESSSRYAKLRFESHVSPFAAALNAIVTLGKWQEGEVEPTMPRSMSESSQFHAETADKPTLQLALELSGLEVDKAQELDDAFKLFYTAVKTLEDMFRRQQSPALRHSRREGRDDGKGGKGGEGGGSKGGEGGGKDPFGAQKFTFPEIQFGSAAPAATDGHDHPAADSYSWCSGSTWRSEVPDPSRLPSPSHSFSSSNAHSDDGVLAPEPQEDSRAQAVPSSAQLIADEYRHRTESTSSRSSPVTLVHPPSPHCASGQVWGDLSVRRSGLTPVQSCPSEANQMDMVVEPGIKEKVNFGRVPPKELGSAEETGSAKGKGHGISTDKENQDVVGKKKKRSISIQAGWRALLSSL